MIKSKEGKLGAVGVALIGTMAVTGAFIAHAESTENKKVIVEDAKKEVALAQKKVNIAEIEKQIKGKYPSTQIKSVEESPIYGIYEISMGNNIAYTVKEGRYFLFGHVYDMHTQTDLTASKVSASSTENAKAEWPKKYLDQALVIKKGSGENVFAVFTDPNCGYCQKLEVELDKLDNVTIYKFIIPMLGNKSESISIWCSENPKQTLKNKMLNGKGVVMASCNNPIQKNLDLAEEMGIRGTPFMIKPNGMSKYGYTEINELKEWVLL